MLLYGPALYSSGRTLHFSFFTYRHGLRTVDKWNVVAGCIKCRLYLQTVAESMLSRDRVDFLSGSVLKASLPVTADEKGHNKPSSAGVDQHDDDDSILLSNIPLGTKKDTLLMFLENRRRCGGGPIKSLHYDESRRTATVTFQDKRSEFL